MPITLIGCFCCKDCRKILPLKDELMKNQCGNCLELEIQLAAEEELHQLKLLEFANGVFKD